MSYEYHRLCLKQWTLTYTCCCTPKCTFFFMIRPKILTWSTQKDHVTWYPEETVNINSPTYSTEQGIFEKLTAAQLIKKLLALWQPNILCRCYKRQTLNRITSQLILVYTLTPYCHFINLISPFPLYIFLTQVVPPIRDFQLKFLMYFSFHLILLHFIILTTPKEA